MVQNLTNRLIQLGTPWLTLLAVIIFGGFLVWVLPQESQRSQAMTGDASAPDTQFWYSAEELYATAEAFGETGRSYYIRSRFTFDIIWPLAYWFFLTAALAFWLRHTAEHSPWRQLIVLPTAAMFLDFGENITVSLVMTRFPEPPGISGSLAPLFTASKWLVIALAFAVLIACAAWRWTRLRWQS